MKMELVLMLFLVLSIVARAYKVLVVFPLGSQSHYILGSSLAKGLARSGLDVTMISSNAQKDPPNYREIVLTGLMEQVRNENMMHAADMYKWKIQVPIVQTLMISTITSRVTDFTLAHPKMQALLNSKNETFDVVIIEQFGNDALKAIAHHFDAPLILVSSMGATKWVNDVVGNPEPPSYIPDFFLNYGAVMSFPQRAINFMFGVYNHLQLNFYSYRNQRNILKKYFPDGPKFEDLQYNVSLVLLNAHESFNQPVPQVPNLINIGGYHVNPPKELPRDLKDFMDNAKEGVIYFSLGSNLLPSEMPSHILQAILKALGSRKEKVLWKWNQDSMPNQPSNVKLSKWFPQQDLLAHPNIKLFITHCGLLSSIETIYHGVPILGIPVFGDQKSNAARVETLGFGKSIHFSQITEENLIQTLNEMIDNPKYRENAKYRSKIMHDRPMKPMDLAVYWVNYVIRHKGAYHLRVAGVDLPLYKYLMLDVIAAILLCIVFSLYVVKKIWRYVFTPKTKLKVN